MYPWETCHCLFCAQGQTSQFSTMQFDLALFNFAIFSDLSENEHRKGMFLGYDVVSLSSLEDPLLLKWSLFIQASLRPLPRHRTGLQKLTTLNPTVQADSHLLPSNLVRSLLRVEWDGQFYIFKEGVVSVCGVLSFGTGVWAEWWTEGGWGGLRSGFVCGEFLGWVYM